MRRALARPHVRQSGRSAGASLGSTPATGEPALPDSLQIVILGLSITSSWGNGHATTFRGLVKELSRQGHRVTFLERDVPWYASQRDLPNPGYCRTELYQDLDDLENRFTHELREADAVIVGSYVPSGVEVGEWAIRTAKGIVAFYDIDTPVTLGQVGARRLRIFRARPDLQIRSLPFVYGRATLRLLESV